MKQCPRCKKVFYGDVTFCPVCGFADNNPKSEEPSFKICPKCNKEYLGVIDHCIECGYSTDSYKKKMKRLSMELTDPVDYIPPIILKCPICRSANIKEISATSKTLGAVGFGIFSKTARSQFECKSCGYKWWYKYIKYNYFHSSLILPLNVDKKIRGILVFSRNPPS